TGNFAGRRVAHDRVFEDRELAIEEGDIDLGRLAGALAVEERRIERDRRVKTAGEVADRGTDARRRLTGVAGDAHDPPEPLHDHVVGRVMRKRAGMAKARGGGVDEARVARMQRVPAIAELFHRAGPKILDDGVGLVQEALEYLAVAGGLEVEDD